jgi:hypothetical protein
MALGADDIDESLGADVGTAEGVLVAKSEGAGVGSGGVDGASEGPEVGFGDFEGEALGADVGTSEGGLVGEGVGPGVGKSDGAELGTAVGDDVGSEEGAGESVGDGLSKSSQDKLLTPSSMYIITLATSGGPATRSHTLTTRSSLPSQLLKRCSPLFSSKVASNQL